ncbi:MAG: arginine--tRNA ligase, partial [Chloroflexi bacterium RBG_16_57_9]
ALKKAQRSDALPAFDLPADIPLSRPKTGDYASPVAMGLARFAKMPPVAIAKQIVRHLPKAEFIGKVEVAHPGFLEFYLDPGWIARQVDAILNAGDKFGAVELGGGKRVQVEFVSANPTGPLHVGSARNAAYGDSLANILDAAGYQVQREYYVNDTGTQMETFNRTLLARYRQRFGLAAEIPADGYAGAYMLDLAREIAGTEGDRFLSVPEDEALEQLGRLGEARVLDWIHADLDRMGIPFDLWFSERSLYANGAFPQIMRILREGDWLVEREGAVWFTAHDPKIKDEVVIRSNGAPGYFASDIAYHYDKFLARGFDWVIDIWGADHQGHVPRMKAMMRSLNLDPDKLTLVIYQNVTLLRGGVEVRM